MSEFMIKKRDCAKITADLKQEKYSRLVFAWKHLNVPITEKCGHFGVNLLEKNIILAVYTVVMWWSGSATVSAPRWFAKIDRTTNSALLQIIAKKNEAKRRFLICPGIGPDWMERCNLKESVYAQNQFNVTESNNSVKNKWANFLP